MARWMDDGGDGCAFVAGGCQHNHRRLQTKIFANPSIIQFLFCGSQHSRSPPIYSMFIHQHVSFGGGLHCHHPRFILSLSFSLASWHNHLSVRGLCLICEPYSMPCSSNNVVTIIIILLNPGDTIHPSIQRKVVGYKQRLEVNFRPDCVLSNLLQQSLM